MKTKINTHEDILGTFDPLMETIDGVVPDASSGDGILRTAEQMYKWAESIGCDYTTATDRQLFIDIDTDRQFAVFQAMRPVFKKHFYFTSVTITPSKQGLPHRHIRIEMGRSWPIMTRLAMQACLGSDPMRELLSIKRAENGEDNIVVFFEKRAAE